MYMKEATRSLSPSVQSKPLRVASFIRLEGRNDAYISVFFIRLCVFRSMDSRHPTNLDLENIKHYSPCPVASKSL